MTQSNRRTTKVKPDELAPDLDSLSAEYSSEYVYWIGLTDDCPLMRFEMAGMGFTKDAARIIEDPQDPTGPLIPSPVKGNLCRLTRQKFDRLRDRLTRTVIAMQETPEQRRSGMIQAPKGAHPLQQAVRGRLVKLPSQEEMEARSKAGRSIRSYTRGPNDRPVADFVYVQLCADQKHPVRGAILPDPVSKTGIEWPEPTPLAAEAV